MDILIVLQYMGGLIERWFIFEAHFVGRQLSEIH